MLAVICQAYNIEQLDQNDSRIVLNFPLHIAPYKIAILPLVKKLSEPALEIFNKLIDKGVSVNYDETGSIGKRYRRQDAIGTFWCLTVDYQTLEDQTITLRNRNSMEQIRISINEIDKYL